jgi:hypothetical protein
VLHQQLKGQLQTQHKNIHLRSYNHYYNKNTTTATTTITNMSTINNYNNNNRNKKLTEIIYEGGKNKKNK